MSPPKGKHSSVWILMFESEYFAAPARTVKFPEEYLERVQRTHEVGGYGSIG